jgi:nucleoside 2-deoxyribosyltransferase
MLMASGKHCFVIMPFSTTGDRQQHTTEYWTNFFSKVIKPAVENLGYMCKRSSAQPGNIMRAIVNELVTSDVVLAVLTDFNPNVMYELGTRHSLKHGTIMMLERGQDIPFDIKHYGVIYYDDNLASGQKFQEDLRDFIQNIESDGPDSPVLDFVIKHEMSSNITTNDKLEIEKRSLADRRQVIYNELDKNIFSPLLDYELETPYDLSY